MTACFPKAFGHIHARFRTPYKSTALTGVCVALAGGLLPLRIVGELVSIGTLLAFVIVSASVMVMRKAHPEIRRPFRTPLVWVVGPLAMIVCSGQMLGLPADTWIRLFVWMAIGLVIYFSYSRRHSVLQNAEKMKQAGGSHHSGRPSENVGARLAAPLVLRRPGFLIGRANDRPQVGRGKPCPERARLLFQRWAQEALP